ncbi:MAG: [Fe-Fe] hydrogenase large subunit C-terminal domain-containing protein [Halothermotrichaceae bacterium]
MAAVIKTSEAKCKDCYKCIRHCPVKAIGLKDEQAWVVEEKCILCGKCIEICPQNAKSTRSYLSQFREYLDNDEKIAVSIAPSYLAAAEYENPWKLINTLRKLGVSIIEETAIGAETIAKEYRALYDNICNENDITLNSNIDDINDEENTTDEKKKDRVENNAPIISSCCPTVVSLVEKNYPELINNLAPLISPMKVHAQLLRKRLGADWKIVFIGPCVSKKDELNKVSVFRDKSSDFKGPDLVLDFKEIIRLFNNKGINPDALADSYPDQYSQARAYPLHRGILEVSGINDSLLGDVITVSGVDELIEVFDDIEANTQLGFIEALGCKGGCIGGPCMANDKGIISRKSNLIKYINDKQVMRSDINEKHSRNRDKTCKKINNKKRVEYNNADQKDVNSIYKNLQKEIELRRQYIQAEVSEIPGEAEIEKILSLTGKVNKEDETNCGGCGYASCREKAVAVYQGLAEPEMCIPYMREKAESLSHAVVDSSVNGIIIVNEDMKIQEFNPAADKMFNRNGVKSKGKPLETFINPADFCQVKKTQKMISGKYKEYPEYDLVTRENIYYLEKYGVIIGLIADVTSEEEQKAEIDNMKQEALDKAKRVIYEQMKVAQEIAGLLGESTAETKTTLLELIDIMNRKEANTGEN